MRYLLRRLIPFETNADAGGDAPPPSPLADPAPTAATEPAPAAPSGPDYDQRFQQLEGYVGQIAEVLQQQQYAQQPQAQQPQAPGLPEWDPYDPEIVHAYNQQWQAQELGPILNQLAQAAQIVSVQQGERIADGAIDQFKGALPAETPGWVKDEIGGDRDLLLQLGAPFLQAGHDPQEVFGHVGNWLAQRYASLGEKAVQAFKDSLTAAADAVPEPGGSGTGTPVPSNEAQPGESVYAAAARQALSRQNPVSI